ncbi:MAG: hypothetical protein ABSB61_05810 [Anaerolineales bacterium]|jgi:hypothetical protein
MHKTILVALLLIPALALSACGIGVVTIPSVTEVTSTITSTRQPTGTPLPDLGGPGIGGYSLFPLKISQIYAGPDPVTGRVMNVRVQIVSTRDEPDTTIRIQTFSDRLKLEGGAPEWHGSLVRNRPQTFDFSVCALYPGQYVIWITTFSQLSPRGSYGDSQVLHLDSTVDSGHVVAGWKWRPTPQGTPHPLLPTPVMTPVVCP